MTGRTTQDSLDLGWSDEPPSNASPSDGTIATPLDNSDDDEPTRVATSAAFVVAPTASEDVAFAPAPREDVAFAPAPREDVALATASTEDVAFAIDPAADTARFGAPLVASEASAVSDESVATAPPGEPANVEASATAAPPSAPPAADALASPPPTSEPPVNEVAPEPSTSHGERAPRTLPPITNPPPAELARPPWAVEPTAAAPVPLAQAPAAIPAAPTAPPSIPPESIAPPPLVPAFVAPASLAPTATDWNEFGSPSFLETMKRTRPTSAWTGVALFVAAATFVGGIGVGHGITSPSVSPIPPPAPLPTNVTATSPATPSLPSTPPVAVTTPAQALGAQSAPEPAAPTKQLPPFDAKAARTALDTAAAKTKTCRTAKEPKGAVAATVTFAPSGRVSDVSINTARYAGTKTGKCITEHLREAQVPEFGGSPTTLKKTVAVR